MTETTLEQLIEFVVTSAKQEARRRELRAPRLAYLRPDTTVGTLAIAIPNVHPAEVVKVVLEVEQATMAALCMESWKVVEEPTPEQRAAFAAGRRPELPRASQHPRRFDALVVVAEVRGCQQQQTHWRIVPVPGGRNFVDEEQIPQDAMQPSNFTPLFGTPTEVRRIAGHHLQLARLRDQLQDRRS